MKHPLLFVVVVLAIVGAAAYPRMFPPVNPDPNHTHADFAIWINGEQLNFEQPKYMSGSSDPNDPHHKEHDEYMHLHDANGHVVHRHKPGLGFNDFLQTIGFKFDQYCLSLDTGDVICNDNAKVWKLYVNGKEVPFVANYLFQDNDQLLYTYGATPEMLKGEFKKMTYDACRYSQTCPWKGAPPKESCTSDPTVPCVVP